MSSVELGLTSSDGTVAGSTAEESSSAACHVPMAGSEIRSSDEKLLKPVEHVVVHAAEEVNSLKREPSTAKACVWCVVVEVIVRSQVRKASLMLGFTVERF